MDVLMVNAFFHPYIGGTEKHMYELSRRLAKKHYVMVITSMLENTPSYENIDGVEVHRLKTSMLKMPHIHPPPYPLLKEKIVPFIEEIKREHGIDVVNIHGRWFPRFNKAIWYAEKNNIPTTLTLHNGRPLGIDKVTSALGTVYDMCEGKKVLKTVSKIIAVSQAVKYDIVNYKLPPEKIHVIHNGVDTARFNPQAKPKFRDEYGFENTLLYVGRMIPQKGLTYLLSAMKILQKTSPDTGLLMVGSGKDRVKLKKLSRER